MTVEVLKLDNNGHKDGSVTHERANGIGVSDGVLYVKDGAKNAAIYQAGFWISAEVK